MGKNGPARIATAIGTGGLSEISRQLTPTASTDTTTNAPWGPTQPYWQDIFAKSATQAGQGPNANTQQGWNMALQAAQNPNNTALLGGSRDYANKVLGGEFLDPTKNLALATQLQNGIAGLGSWDQAASQAGRYGSDAWSTGRGKQLADLQGNLYGQGLQQMTQMAGMAPSIYNSQLLPSGVMSAVGQEQGAYPWMQMQNQANMLRAAGGGETTQPIYMPSQLSQLIGAGTALVGAGRSMSGGKGGGQ